MNHVSVMSRQQTTMTTRSVARKRAMELISVDEVENQSFDFCTLGTFELDVEKWNEYSPEPKRPRTTRAKIPTPLQKEALRVTDRFSGPHRPDTEEGHLVFSVGENFTPRFKIMRKFGEGTFGRVIEAWDRKKSMYVAIKVIRAVEKYKDAAMVELQVLATLAANDPEHKYPIVRLREWFEYRGHVCMVFDRLGPSIYDCLRRNAYRPFPLPMVKSFLRQVLQSVAYMHSFSLIHTDLKPENILFLSDELITVHPPRGSKLARRLPPNDTVRLIDFGSAAFEEDYHSTIVSTRHYRAPEIILGLGWSFPCDLWSVGCILVELVTGDALFQTHENLEHLAMMERVIGAMPENMAANAVRPGCSSHVTALFRRGQTRLAWPEAASCKRSVRAVARLRPLKDYLLAHSDDSIRPEIDDIVDLLTRLLRWEPGQRVSAQEALLHPFFNL